MRADVAGAEALYKKAGDIDSLHANSIYNYAVLLDSSLKQHEVHLPSRIAFTTRHFPLQEGAEHAGAFGRSFRICTMCWSTSVCQPFGINPPTFLKEGRWIPDVALEHVPPGVFGTMVDRRCSDAAAFHPTHPFASKLGTSY